MRVWQPFPNGVSYLLPDPEQEKKSMKSDVEFKGKRYVFFDEDEEGPALPLRMAGTYPAMGWDIPNYWAIDAGGQAWADVSGHSFGLKRCEVVFILRSMESEQPGSSAELRKKLNMKPLMPSWMHSALSANWTPPQGFDPNFYTKE